MGVVLHTYYKRRTDKEMKGKAVAKDKDKLQEGVKEEAAPEPEVQGVRGRGDRLGSC